MQKKYELDLRECPAPKCTQCSNRDVRDVDEATGFCRKFLSGRDGLPVRCVGEWAHEKIYYLTQYFGIFAQGMKRSFDELRYVEICSGPGRCCTRNKLEIDGTPLTVLNHPNFKYIRKAAFFDYNQDVVTALNKRIQLEGKDDRAQAYVGDYNDTGSITDKLRDAGGRSLTLCLVDPTNCSVPFKMIRDMYDVSQGKCDFIISFFDMVDYNRNSVQAILGKSELLYERYSSFLGSNEFFGRPEIVEAARVNDRAKLLHAFIDEYICQLKRIGLICTDRVRIGNLYHLLYASSHPRGLDFWKKCSKYDPHGQGMLGI